MSNRTESFKSFADLAKAMHQADVEAANRLRKSAPLRKGRKPGRGPAVAVPKLGGK